MLLNNSVILHAMVESLYCAHQTNHSHNRLFVMECCFADGLTDGKGCFPVFVYTYIGKYAQYKCYKHKCLYKRIIKLKISGKILLRFTEPFYFNNHSREAPCEQSKTT
ncbi:hypothetical protein BpHYR1_029801 [Brachionus plicatilis]|uniref:Uncharacterized protein n=1 Tax=Brachionus plicatilis TaxID=10195 RepID=A0A3M7SSL0_BRAPC|nr:hypothetical protein BpHYR1_029801 [Brachionus plicatilis]